MLRRFSVELLLQMTRLDNPVNVKRATLHLCIINLLIELQRVEKTIEASVIRHHEREKLGILRLVLNGYLLRKYVLYN